MRSSYVDKRAKRYAARQFVSDYEVPNKIVPNKAGVLAVGKDNKENSSRYDKEKDRRDAAYERVSAPIKFYARDRGYGFLKRPNHPDIFFTGKELEKAGYTNAKENWVFEFDLVPVQGKGGRAINLKRVEK